ncbi:zinc-binding dehydrogenase [Microbacterium sp. A196]|uniref:zinc-binding dehydrogenase n=1 Tax=unclassified Microbacterium TaxID=2609290 RepID=UPI003FD2D0C7
MTRAFRAAVLRGRAEDGTVQFGVEELEHLEELDPQYVEVRVTASNVSISDQLFIRDENQGGPGPLPRVLGHGGVGIVERIGDAVTAVKIGDRVLIYGTPQCDDCWYCRNGRPDWCAQIQFDGPAIARTKDGLGVHASSAVGSFAEAAIVPQSQLVAVDTELGDDVLSFLTISGSSGIGPALRIAAIKPTDTVAVVGLGPCGLSYVQAAKLAGARTVIGIDPVAARREVAAATGADLVIDPTDVDPVAAVQAAGPDRGGPLGRGADMVFEASASTEGMQQAWAMAPAGGTVVLSSVPLNMGASVEFPATPLACQGKTVHGSQQGGFGIRRDTPAAIDLLESGALDFGAILDSETDLSGIAAMLDAVAERRVIGATLYPGR